MGCLFFAPYPMKTKLPRIYVDTLGCSKNMVDSEVFVAQCKANAFDLAHSPDQADILVINTCGFIESAKQESIDHILDGVNLKKEGKIQKLLVMGCLSHRYSDALRSEIPEVDEYYGSEHIAQILSDLGGSFKYDLIGERSLSTPNHFAYLKISEGCDNPCSFCAIPIMRGKHKSKSLELIETEAKALRNKGVRELILIAQDLTYYGLDLYGKRNLADLLKVVSDVGFEWIKLLYAYPADFPKDILNVIRERENICNYLDMPIQHTETQVLKSMKRRINRKKLEDLIQHIREEVPGMRMRTTLILGYPEETESHFESMLEFLAEVKFDRLGVFPYSLEDDTSAFPLGDPIPDKVKMDRVRQVMRQQEAISLEKNEKLIGEKLTVLIDRIDSGVAYGRTQWDCPEVDNEVVIDQAVDSFSISKLKAGEFYKVEITDSEAFDLFGKLHAPVATHSAASY